MRIRRLKLSGFKSFVEPAELRIEPGLTGVVGPNGCGKSNLLEAIRWVMGESSPKSMRGGGMDDVIFAGTATPAAARLRRSLDPARARAERRTAARGEIEVTRRIERGAGSAYRINGRDVRAKDVALLFADAATGAHSPALVSQGKISAIIAAKPVERRLLLEEAAGISGLHARRKDAEQKLRATEANLTRLGEILADQEQRGGALRRQARAAERYRKLSDQIRVGRSAAAPRALARGRGGGRAAPAEARRRPRRSPRVQQAIAQRPGRAEQARRRSPSSASALARAARAGRTRWRMSSRRRAPARHGRAPAGGTRPARCVADRGHRSARRRCSGDAGAAIAQLEEERSAIARGSQTRRPVGADRDRAQRAPKPSRAKPKAALAECWRGRRRCGPSGGSPKRRSTRRAAQLARTEQEAQRLDEQAAALGDGAEHEAARADAERRGAAAAAALAEAASAPIRGGAGPRRRPPKRATPPRASLARRARHCRRRGRA